MKKLKKITAIILIQAFALTNLAWADMSGRSVGKSTLSPKIAIDINSFRLSYDDYRQKRVLNDGIILPKGILGLDDITSNAVVLNQKSTNFKIRDSFFRIPPYLSQRIARVHITDIGPQGFEFQKMGIGAGQRKKTIAVVLVDLSHLENQLLVYEKDGYAVLKHLDQNIPEETIALGANVQFDSLDRQDSFLERSDNGLSFIDRALNIEKAGESRAKSTVTALNGLASSNPELKKDLPVNLAFFSKDYMLSFSENLRNHSHIAVLRDRPQRGRLIAIIDRLNPDNYVVFERRGQSIFILGENERQLVPEIRKNKQAQMIYFTDLPEGAEFCRNVCRDLIQLQLADYNSTSIRQHVQIYVGSVNSGMTVLKADQVTRATVTGYQIKKRAPGFPEDTQATFPVYIMRDGFKADITVDDIKIDYESEDFIFFDPAAAKFWPRFLSYGDADNSVYYQKAAGLFKYKNKEYTVYRAIAAEDIVTSLRFRSDAGFTIKGINWQDGKPVAFRNIKNISLPNIVTQLKASKFINISHALLDHFDMTDTEPGFNPVRSTYIFKYNGFEQGKNIKMGQTVDFSDIQKKQDRKIAKAKSFKLRLPKAAFILSVFAAVFAAQSLFAAEPGQLYSDVLSQYQWINDMFFAAAGIAPIMPVQPALKVKKDNKQPDMTGKGTVKKQDAVLSSDRVEISPAAAVLSQNRGLLDRVNNIANEKDETYFSLENKNEKKKTDFCIRPFKDLKEAVNFRDSFGINGNVDWSQIFKMAEGFNKNQNYKNRFFIYGVFELNELGQEIRAVAAGNYLIQKNDGEPKLLCGNVEVLPQAKNEYKGIGSALCLKILCDAVRENNLPFTQGNVLFKAKNFRRGMDPKGFYKKFGLKPQPYGKGIVRSEENDEYKLSLTEVIGLIKQHLHIFDFRADIEDIGLLQAGQIPGRNIEQVYGAGLLTEQAI